MVTKNQKNQENFAIFDGLYRSEQDKSASRRILTKNGSCAMAGFFPTTFLRKPGQINVERFASNFHHQNCT